MSWINWYYKPVCLKIVGSEVVKLWFGNVEGIKEEIEKERYERRVDVVRLQRIKEADMIEQETVIRKSIGIDEANSIPPDYDETTEPRSNTYLPLPVLIGDDQNSNDDLIHLGKLKHSRGRPQNRVPIPKKLRQQLVKSRGGICEECKDEIFQQCHHIDGNPSNNDPDNLMLVCYECHKKIEKNKRKKYAVY